MSSRRDVLVVAGLTAVILPVGCVLTGAFAKAGATSIGVDLVTLGVWYVWAAMMLPIAAYFTTFYRSTRSPEGGPGGRMLHLMWTRCLPLSVVLAWQWADRSPADFGPNGSPAATAWFTSLPMASLYTAVMIAGVVARRSLQRRTGAVVAAIGWRRYGRFRLPTWQRPEPRPPEERIDPPARFGPIAFWTDVALGALTTAASIVAVSLLATGVHDAVAALLPRGLLSSAAAWSVKAAAQFVLNFWVVNANQRALTEGLRDFDASRDGIFVVIGAPPVLVLVAGVWFHSLIESGVIALLLTVAVGVRTDAPPEATFGTWSAVAALFPVRRALGSARTWFRRTGRR